MFPIRHSMGLKRPKWKSNGIEEEEKDYESNNFQVKKKSLFSKA
jgi:hypothetical protein